MRTIVHLSDLHFGRIDQALIGPLRQAIEAIVPDVVVVSGDLTQRARSKEFAAASDFLGALPKPQVVVPGNHDIPLHNVFNRFVRPLDKYRRYIATDTEPSWTDSEIAVFGVNTARSATIKDGSISAEQIEHLQSRLRSAGPDVIKVVVTHHPFDLPAHYRPSDLVGRASIAMRAFAEYGVDLLLAGHHHASHAGETAVRHRIGGYAAIAVQAGTATSTRGRGEVNSFNVIRIESPRITVARFGWADHAATFDNMESHVFERTAKGWVAASDVAK